MLTYNAFLYTERNNMGLSRRKMAKFLKMPLFYYSMVEKGYFKPTKKQVARISEKLEVDYQNLQPITFDAVNNKYLLISEEAGDAFKVGLKLK